MNTSTAEAQEARAERIAVDQDSLTVDLADGRSLSVPLSWFPRLLHGSKAEREHWRLIGRGEGIHWPDLDEDVSVENLLLGRPSGESQASLKKWLEARQNGAPAPRTRKPARPPAASRAKSGRAAKR